MVLIIKRPLNLRTKTIAIWRISIEMRYWDVDFYLRLPQLTARFDALLSTTKAEFRLFTYLCEGITLIFIVCVWEKNLLAFCAEILVELVSFSMIYWQKVWKLYMFVYRCICVYCDEKNEIVIVCFKTRP